MQDVFDRTSASWSLRALALGGIVMVLATAGCTEKPLASAALQLPPDMKANLTAAALANATARNCKTALRFNEAGFEKFAKTVRDFYAANGAGNFNERTLDGYLDSKEMQNEFLAYVEKRDILLTEDASWCAAGDAEIAAASPVGAFLRKRS